MKLRSILPRKTRYNRNKIADRVLIDWKLLNERIITSRFYSKLLKLTVIQVYAPTTDAEDEVKYAFYEELQTIDENGDNHDMVVVSGDMNAEAGAINKETQRIRNKYRIAIIYSMGKKSYRTL